MTNKEAHTFLLQLHTDKQLNPSEHEALRVAIKALEQEPCEDCISRAELLKAVDTWDKFGCDADTKIVPIKDCYVPYIHYDDVVKAIKGMPSIQPKAKVGKWKYYQNKKGDWINECSVCKRDAGVGYSYNFCPNCGAKMESEDK